MKGIYTSIALVLTFGVFQVLAEDEWKSDFISPQDINILNFNTRLTRNKNQAAEWLSNLFENIRQAIRKGLKAFNLPPLDPLKLGDIHISKDMVKNLGSFIDIKGDLSNLTVTGLGGFVVTSADFILIPPRIYANFLIPALKLSGNNKLDGKIAKFVPLSSSGPFSLTAKSVNISVDVPVTYTDDFHMVLGDLKLKFDVKEFDSKIASGFTGGMVNSVLSGTIKTAFDNFVPARFQELSSLLRNFINSYLSKIYTKHD